VILASKKKRGLLNSYILFYRALLDNNISATLHIFPQGGHSIALRNNPGSTALWPELCEMWLREIGVIE
jgi:hypothetical protein